PISDLQEVFPHLVDLVGLKDVSDALTDVEDSDLRLYRLLRRGDRPEKATGFALLQLGAHGSNPVGLYQLYLDAHLAQLKSHRFVQLFSADRYVPGLPRFDVRAGRLRVRFPRGASVLRAAPRGLVLGAEVDPAAIHLHLLRRASAPDALEALPDQLLGEAVVD